MTAPGSHLAAGRDRPSRREGRYLPGLDGIRALAVIAVVIFHSSLGIAPAGFLGVEVFFVISGFIITWGLVREWGAGDGIALRAFWLRRARRLLPALFLLLLGVTGWALLFLSEEVAGLRNDALAALGYVTNWYLILSGENYFDTFTRPSLFRHLWSLAIEEQFYVLWPLITLAGLRLLRPRMLALVIVAGALASVLWMGFLFEPGRDVSRVYFGTDTRLSGLFLGGALALLWSPPAWAPEGRVVRGALDLLAAAALAVLVWVTFALDENAPLLYRGGFLLVDLATIALLIPAVRAGTWASRVLGVWPLRWIGLRSYGIYLWHWPVFMVTRPGEDVGLEGPLLVALQVAAALAISAASYSWLELPVRRGALGRLWRRCRAWRAGAEYWRLGGATAGAVGVLAVVGLVGGAAALARPPEVPDYFKLESIRIVREAAGADLSPASRLPAAMGGEDAVASVFAAGLVRSSTFAGDPAELILSPTPRGIVIQLPPLAALAGGRVLDFPDGPAADPEPIRVTAIGDSVMLGAAARLAEDLSAEGISIDVDAAVSRAMVNAIQVLADRAAVGELGNVILIHIGNNGPIDEEQVKQVMRIAGEDRRVVFLNVRVPRYWEEPNNEVLARAVPRYPNAVLVDWYGASASRPEIFWSDGIHLRPQGAAFYSTLLRPYLEPGAR